VPIRVKTDWLSKRKLILFFHNVKLNFLNCFQEKPLDILFVVESNDSDENNEGWSLKRDIASLQVSNSKNKSNILTNGSENNTQFLLLNKLLF
jgi:hypothetical protein